MSIQLKCACGTALKVSELQIGQIIGCPGCGTQLSVPGVLPVLQLPELGYSDEDFNAPFAPWQDENQNSNRRLLPLVLTGVGLVCCLSVVAFVFFSKVQVAGPDPVPGPVVANSSQVVTPPEAKTTESPAPLAIQPGVEGLPDQSLPKLSSPPASTLPPAPIVLNYPTVREYAHTYPVYVKHHPNSELSDCHAEIVDVDSDLKLNAFFVLNRAVGGCDDSICLGIEPLLKESKLPRAREVIIQADDKTITVARTERNVIASNLADSHEADSVSFHLDLDSFLRLIEAKKVLMLLESREIVLAPESLEALRELASHLPVGNTIRGTYLVKRGN